MLTILVALVIVLLLTPFPAPFRQFGIAALSLIAVCFVVWNRATWWKRREAAGEVLMNLGCRRVGTGLMAFLVVVGGAELVGSLQAGDFSLPELVPLALVALMLSSVAIERRTGIELREHALVMRTRVTPWERVESFHWGGFMGNTALLRVRMSLVGFEFHATMHAVVPTEERDRFAEIVTARIPADPSYVGSPAAPP